MVVDDADVHEVPEVLVVVEGVADNELVGDFEAHVVGHVAVAERRALAQEARDN